ncbi:DHH family phosphoesterase [Candidatus Woesearchaeota archaeon]|jgi:oligoribonuclease NrnB/cAMP/cGMP phosphodiesterase (DHH superfamily)|nr:DHH family phosphoesterase [Candidatus Woesearchaeota archaeon]MBT3537020.1 DHH family phosphoesterase [Candidatus Woesearchaeota archaeon]MBT4697630.1 DHH family phosphoesterase [Candidatus Woesearchaeota archaeon]MBT7106670.1 DHH family phosphoesterase [Candidatus Woesearchaeota archaeon]MBT7931768.1 DHH family phosphoesterase [Candidatus Woesearchaeota archaeon]
MVLSQKQLIKIKDELDHCTRPLFLFDSDPDGTASFLLFYRYLREGRGVMVKNSPEVTPQFLKKVEEYDPDKIFILDKPLVSQDFLDRVHIPVVWLDHHEPQNMDKVEYFNSRTRGEIQPTSCMAYQVVKHDLWIAMMGCVGDWYLPDFKDEFIAQYPDLLSKKIKTPPQALFDSKLGELVKVVSFILKGKTDEAMKCIKILTRIASPYEILNQETPRGKYIYKRYEKLKVEYDEILNEAKKAATKDKILFYAYRADRNSFTKELSNEMLYLFPTKIIMLGREKSGDMKLSLRSSKVNISNILKKALVGIEGNGGGHDLACGASVSLRDFDRFMEQFREELSKSKGL